MLDFSLVLFDGSKDQYMDDDDANLPSFFNPSSPTFASSDCSPMSTMELEKDERIFSDINTKYEFPVETLFPRSDVQEKCQAEIEDDVTYEDAAVTGFMAP